MSNLIRGRIVYLEVLDPQDRNPKTRPAVIVTPTAEIRAEGDLDLVAITGRLDSAPADVQVELPWHPQGRAGTKLTKACVAVCTWIFASPVSSVRRTGGIVPDPKMLQILEILRKIADSSRPPGKPPV